MQCEVHAWFNDDGPPQAPPAAHEHPIVAPVPSPRARPTGCHRAQRPPRSMATARRRRLSARRTTLGRSRSRRRAASDTGAAFALPGRQCRPLPARPMRLPPAALGAKPVFPHGRGQRSLSLWGTPVRCLRTPGTASEPARVATPPDQTSGPASPTPRCACARPASSNYRRTRRARTATRPGSTGSRSSICSAPAQSTRAAACRRKPSPTYAPDPVETRIRRAPSEPRPAPGRPTSNGSRECRWLSSGCVTGCGR